MTAPPAGGGTWEFLKFWLWTSYKLGSKKKS